MDRKRISIEPEYIVEGRGKRVSAIMPRAEYGTLLEDIGGRAAVAERRTEETVSH